MARHESEMHRQRRELSDAIRKIESALCGYFHGKDVVDGHVLKAYHIALDAIQHCASKKP